MKRVRVGINGMGRIGRMLTRLIVREYREHLELVAVNDVAPVDLMVPALKRDSTYGPFPVEVAAVSDDEIRLGNGRVHVSQNRDPAEIRWREAGADLVFECSGLFLTREAAGGHLAGGARKAVISAPPKDETPVFVIGVNDNELTGSEEIVSNASCTTNCLAPIVKAMDESFGVVSGVASTTHAVTSGQSVVDGFGSERARSALNNIIPTTTGAAKSVGRAIPHLVGKLNSSGLRVPVTTGSVVEAVLVVQGVHSPDEVVRALREQAEVQNRQSPMGTVLYVGDDYQVSADAVGSPWSSMVLANNLMTVPFEEMTLVKITSFYDNELGYAHRLAELGMAVMQ
jgi:glyceraldehyde 3-phosphate dehydrogenase (phosphorylating)